MQRYLRLRNSPVSSLVLQSGASTLAPIESAWSPTQFLVQQQTRKAQDKNDYIANEIAGAIYVLTPTALSPKASSAAATCNPQVNDAMRGQRQNLQFKRACDTKRGHG